MMLHRGAATAALLLLAACGSSIDDGGTDVAVGTGSGGSGPSSGAGATAQSGGSTGSGTVFEGQRVLIASNQGYTPEAEALVPAMVAQQAALFVHTGDVDFSFADLGQACERWPNLPYYCSGTVPALTPDEIRAGWRTMMTPIFPALPTLIAWGNHEKDGMKFGEVQPYYLDLFQQTDLYLSTTLTFGGRSARLILVDTSTSLDEGSPQRTWLDAELASADDWHIVLAHGQPWSENKPALDLRPLTCDMTFDAWLGGHPLAYERSAQGNCHLDATTGQAQFDVVDADENVVKGAGRIFVSSGGSGMHVCGTWDNPPIDNPPDYMANVVCYDETFVILEWTDDGLGLTLRAIDAAGATRDEVTIE